VAGAEKVRAKDAERPGDDPRPPLRGQGVIKIFGQKSGGFRTKNGMLCTNNKTNMYVNKA
jgi:hypothetical protein